MMTYAVIGRNVAATLATALDQVLSAAESKDRIVFVDSASSDGSDQVARTLGVEVMPAPEGKGRAVAALLARERRDRPGRPTCLIDGDIEWSSCNIPAALRDAWLPGEMGMLIGTFGWPSRHELSASDAIHGRLIRALFPEQADALAPRPLSGFRVLGPGLRLGRLPPGYGLEAHLNAKVSAIGARIATVELGLYEGPVVRRGAAWGREMGTPILRVAEADGRISPEMRPAWDRWLAGAAEAFGSVPAGATDLSLYEARLREASDRPLPPR